MRQTVILVTILILGVSLAAGLLSATFRGGSDPETTLVTRSAATATVLAGTPIASPSPAATATGAITPQLIPWT